MTESAAHATVLIADDHVVVAEGLAVTLAQYFDVVGQVTQLDLLLEAIRATRPDVVVLDISFGGVSSLALLKEARDDASLDTKFVVLTAHESPALTSAAFDAGASAYLVKGAGTHELRLAVEAALEGRQFSVVEGREAGWGTPRGSPWGHDVHVGGIALRPRQIWVLNLLVDGRDRLEIARELDVTINAVDYHLRGARVAVGTPNLRLLTLWAVEHAEALRIALDGHGDGDRLVQ